MAQLRLGVLAESLVLISTGAQHRDVHSVFAPRQQPLLMPPPAGSCFPFPSHGLPLSDARRPSCSLGPCPEPRSSRTSLPQLQPSLASAQVGGFGQCFCF